mmetsp:Transcript_3421/g.6718  ORF Transcript_3421/g.6718 Transcript_3421/m.6718 type:complete len:213 (+) Transcript_3421:159-797(+)
MSPWRCRAAARISDRALRCRLTIGTILWVVAAASGSNMADEVPASGNTSAATAAPLPTERGRGSQADGIAVPEHEGREILPGASSISSREGLPHLLILFFCAATVACCAGAAVLARRALLKAGVVRNARTLGGSPSNSQQARQDRDAFLRELAGGRPLEELDQGILEDYQAFMSDTEEPQPGSLYPRPSGAPQRSRRGRGRGHSSNIRTLQP